MALTVLQHASNATNASSNTIPLTYNTAATAGSLIVVSVGFEVAAGSVVSVSDGTNSFTHATADALITGVASAEIWYLPSAVGGTSVVTATFSAAAGTYAKTIRMWEVSGFTSPTVDVASGVSNQTGAGTTISGPSLTATAAGFAAAAAFCTAGVSQNPKTGSAWTAGGDIDGFGLPGCSILYGSGGSIQAQWLDNASSDSYCASSVAFKESGGGGGRTLFYRSGLDGLTSNGPKQLNPSLG